MSVSRVKIPLSSTPKKIYDAFDHSIPMPDGVGVQIIYKIKGEYYAIVGPRAQGKVMAVNGGAINPQEEFLDKISTKLNEETFGLMSIRQCRGRFFEIDMKGGESIPALYDASLTAIEVNQAQFYTYVTFSMICSALSLEQLQGIAAKLSPEAMFWHQIGSYLREECANGARHSDFIGEYWLSPEKIAERETMIDAWVDAYDTLSAKQAFMLDPATVLERPTLRQGLERINDIHSYYDLTHFVKHVVGNYSQRAGYHVVNLNDLVLAAKKPELDVVDVNGENIGKGVYYPDVVSFTFDRLRRKDAIYKAMIVSQLSLFRVDMNYGSQVAGLHDSMNALHKLQ